VKRAGTVRGVWLLRDGQATFRTVTVGAETLDGAAQVISGLGAGDAVIVHSSRPLQEGARVAVEDSLVRAAP
jgi:hypothetical protein